MALKSAKKARLPVASMKPTEMSSGGGGLEDNVSATIAEVRITKWNYDKDDKPFVLAARVKYEPDEEQEDDAIIRPAELEKNGGYIVQHYSAGKLEHFAPATEDGYCDLDSDDPEDWDGIFAAPTEELLEKLGDRYDEDDESTWPRINMNTNWGFWVQKLVDCGFPEESAVPDVQCFEGLHVMLHRVPQPKRSGMADSATGGGQQRERQILVVTELLDKPKKGKAAAKGAAAAKGKVSAKSKRDEDEDEEEDEAPTKKGKSLASKKASAKSNGSDLNATVEAAIVAALKKAPLVEVEDEDGDTVEVRQMQRTKLHQFAIKAVGSSDKKAALELMNDEEFYEQSEVLQFDPDEGTVTLIEA